MLMPRCICMSLYKQKLETEKGTATLAQRVDEQ